MSTAMAFIGTKGSPLYCFEVGRAKSTIFFIAARGLHDMYTNLLNLFALRNANKAFWPRKKNQHAGKLSNILYNIVRNIVNYL